MSEKDPRVTAEKIVHNMSVFYEKYQKSSQELVRENIRSGGWISRWFTGTNTVEKSEIHKQFYDAVEMRCKLLDECLTQLSAQEAQPFASRAVSIVLNPIPDSLRDPGTWMLLAAEPLCAPLLKYLPRQELQTIRDNYVDVYPKRKMFDTQKAFLKVMDELLAKS